jgi:hypothetical protein
MKIVPFHVTVVNQEVPTEGMSDKFVELFWQNHQVE